MEEKKKTAHTLLRNRRSRAGATEESPPEIERSLGSPAGSDLT